MKIELLSGRLERATAEAAAFDIFYEPSQSEEIVFLYGDLQNRPDLRSLYRLSVGSKPVAVPTGVCTKMDRGFVGLIREKSGLGLRGVQVLGGVIDSDYRDEWKVILRCVDGSIWLEPGQKIAQVIFLELPSLDLVGEGWSLSAAERTGGFGSTGL